MRHKKLTSLLLFTSLTFSTVGCSVDNFDANKKIESIKLVNTIEDEENGTTFEYTITFLDGTEYTFEVRNGKDGEQGIQGEPGKDGHTPVIEIGENGNWIIDGEDTGISAKGLDGVDGIDGEDGVSIVSIEKTSSEGLIDTYTITYSDNSTSTFTVVNGKQGEQGIQGEPGRDGHTPVIEIGKNGNWVIDGVDTGVKAQGLNGNDGLDGKDGLSAYEIYVKYHPEYKGTEEEWIDDLVNNRLGEEEVAETHTITFDLNGGTYDGPTVIKVKHGEPIKNLPIPTKYYDNNDELVFWGWFTGTTANDGKIDNYTPITSDLNLIAMYSGYKVTYLDENDDVIDVEWHSTNIHVEQPSNEFIRKSKNNNNYLYRSHESKRSFVDETLKPEYVILESDIPSYVTDWEIINAVDTASITGSIVLEKPSVKIKLDLSLYNGSTSITIPNKIADFEIVEIEISDLNNNNAVNEITLNDAALKVYASNIRDLKTINCNANIRTIYGHNVYDLETIDLSNKSNLELVDLSNCPSLSAVDFSNSSLLKVISLSDLNSLSNINFSNNVVNSIFLSNLSNLKTLDLSNTKFESDFDHFDNFLRNPYITLVLPNLTDLDLSNAIYEPSSMGLTINCEKLTSLTLPEKESDFDLDALRFVESETTKLSDFPFIKKVNWLELSSTTGNSKINGLAIKTFYYQGAVSNIGHADWMDSVAFENCTFDNSSNLIFDRIHSISFMDCDNINISSLFINTSHFQLNEIHFGGNTFFNDIDKFIFTEEYFPDLTDIYFNGTEEEWNNIEKDPSNIKLFDGSVTIHFEE